MNISDTLAELVAIPSPSGGEDDVANFLASWVQENTDFQPQRIGDNLLIHVPGKDTSKCVVFNGHVDTVPVGDRSTWRTDPYVLTKQDEVLIGLGTSDMKGAVAVMLHLLVAYQATPPACDVYVLFVAEEETSGAGTQAILTYMERESLLVSYDAVAGVVGESTEMDVRLGHRGNAFVEMVFRGDGSHGATPGDPKRQAILRASAFVESINNTVDGWNLRFVDPLLGDSSATVTKFIAGLDESANQVPSECRITLDVRTVPQLHEVVEEELGEWAERFGASFSVISQSPAGACLPSESIAQVAMKLAGQDTPLVAQGSTDQCFMSEAGIATIICGPGVRSAIHTPNEYVRAESLDECLRRYMSIVDEWSTN